jgi:hypothetical protein
MAFTQNVAMSVSNLPRDTHQMLLHELHRENREDALKVDLIGGRPVDQRVGASDQYLILDSSNRNRGASDLAFGKFVFDIQNGTGTAAEIIGVHDELHTISEIEFQSFPMPDIRVKFVENESSSTVTAIANTNPCGEFVSVNQLFYTDQLYPQFPVINKITGVDLPGTGVPLLQASDNRFEIQVAETSLQSFPDPCGFRHNFSFDLNYLNNQLYANPVSPVFVFTDPIVTISRLSITFFDAYRCIPLHFHEEGLQNVRIGVRSNAFPLAPRTLFHLNIVFANVFPPFEDGDSLYVSPTNTVGAITPHECFDTKIYEFITSCGLGSKGINDYPLTAYGLAPITVTAGVSLRNDTGIQYWVSDSNPYIQYPVSYNATVNAVPLTTNDITFLYTAADALLYGYTDFNSLTDIIILVSNLLSEDANTQNIFTCMNSSDVLYKYDNQDTDKVKINTCRVTLYLDKLVASPALTPPLVDSVFHGLYHIKNGAKDFRFAPNAGDPTNNAIRLTGAKPLYDINPNSYLTNTDLFSWTRKAILPNIGNITVCIPKNHLRLPVRIRRILRRVTQLGGL